MQAGRISYSSARQYCGDDDEFPLFWRVIRAMDSVYLDHVNGDGKPKSFTRESFRGAFSSK